MTNAETIDTALKIIYIDPLIEDAVMDYTNAKQRWQVVLGDELIHPYIQKLDEEIFSDPPILTPKGIDEWEEDKLSDMATQIMDKARTFGWAVVQFYKNEPLWRIFSVDELKTWTYNSNGDVIGANFTLTTNTGSTTQICVWGYKQCYILKFKEGDGKKNFAYPDISQALWTAATITRQIRNQLDVMCAKPEFPHVIYGDSVTPTQRAAILNSLDDTSITNGIGATENAVKEIRMIQHQSFTELMDAVDRRTKHFAGLTRLPYAFYNGERGTGGLSSPNESGIEMQIDKRKQHIFNKIKGLIIELYLERYNITLTDIEMDINEVELEQTPITPIAIDNKDELPKKEDEKEDGQKD